MDLFEQKLAARSLNLRFPDYEGGSVPNPATQDILRNLTSLRRTESMIRYVQLLGTVSENIAMGRWVADSLTDVLLQKEHSISENM
jgi:hypothetical protein